jgi:hypothetical protein
LHAPAETDPDLALIVAAWAGLPIHVKLAISALVRTTTGDRE